MNSQKVFSLIVIFAAMSAGAITAFAAPSGQGPAPIPSVSAVLPDPLPLDMTHTPAFEAPIKIQTTSAITIFGSAPKSPGKVWTCSEPRPLENDATATVKTCEWL